LSGRTYARRIPAWRELGYCVNLIYLHLDSVDLAIARVAARVAQGGHDVQEEVIRRRFEAGRRNFEQVHKQLVDGWAVYDNSAGLPQLIERRNNQ
jgi:predicted ABC-type ATPase